MKDYIKKYREFLEAIILVVIRIIIYSNMKRYVLLGDSQDYISIEAGEYLNGFIHKRRMPLYPILIDFSDYIAKKFFWGGRRIRYISYLSNGAGDNIIDGV